MVEPKVPLVASVQTANGHALFNEERHVGALVGKDEAGGVDGRHQRQNLVQYALGGVVGAGEGDAVRGKGANVRLEGDAPLGGFVAMALEDERDKRKD